MVPEPRGFIEVADWTFREKTLYISYGKYLFALNINVHHQAATQRTLQCRVSIILNNISRLSLKQNSFIPNLKSTFHVKLNTFLQRLNSFEIVLEQKNWVQYQTCIRSIHRTPLPRIQIHALIYEKGHYCN